MAGSPDSHRWKSRFPSAGNKNATGGIHSIYKYSSKNTQKKNRGCIFQIRNGMNRQGTIADMASKTAQRSARRGDTDFLAQRGQISCVGQYLICGALTLHRPVSVKNYTTSMYD